MIGILGGGLSGLALAHCLKQPHLVFEAEARPGGLCRTWSKDGFSTDVGGHILFSRDAALLDAVTAPLGENVHERTRVNRVLHDGYLIEYPFENGLGRLPESLRANCLIDAFKASHGLGMPQNLEQWCRCYFGNTIADEYLIPYNRKLWKREPRELSTCWVDRVPRPPLEDMIKAALGVPTVGYAHQARFRYPKLGGIQALTDALARGVRLHTGVHVDQLETIDTGWTVQGGWNIERGKLVSTIPLPRLVDMLEECPSAVQEAAADLRWLGVTVVNLHVRWARKPPWTAVYTADPRVPFHRVCWNENFSDSMAPVGHCSISCESTYDPSAPGGSSAWCECWLRELGLLESKDEVIGSNVIDQPMAYVVPDLAYPDAVRIVREYVEGLGIRLLGRFGRWEYLNMDQCVRDALALAKELDQ